MIVKDFRVGSVRRPVAKLLSPLQSKGSKYERCARNQSYGGVDAEGCHAVLRLRGRAPKGSMSEYAILQGTRHCSSTVDACLTSTYPLSSYKSINLSFSAILQVVSNCSPRKQPEIESFTTSALVRLVTWYAQVGQAHTDIQVSFTDHCTSVDLLTRGIDIQAVNVVINFG
jgi:hypothetical protein